MYVVVLIFISIVENTVSWKYEEWKSVMWYIGNIYTRFNF